MMTLRAGDSCERESKTMVSVERGFAAPAAARLTIGAFISLSLIPSPHSIGLRRNLSGEFRLLHPLKLTPNYFVDALLKHRQSRSHGLIHVVILVVAQPAAENHILFLTRQRLIPCTECLVLLARDGVVGLV